MIATSPSPGDLFEVTPSHTVYGRCQSPAEFYERLRHRNPAPFEFLFNLGEGEYLVGASPEMYVRVTGDRVETCPIAGTTARGADPVEDAERIYEDAATRRVKHQPQRACVRRPARAANASRAARTMM